MIFTINKIQKEYSKQELRNMGIFQFSKIPKVSKDGDIVYIAATPYYNYNGYQHNTTRAYSIINGNIAMLFKDLSNHRANQAIINYEKYLDGRITTTIWNNYITNGFTTRRGLFADYNDNNIDIMKCMSNSHANYIGKETGNSTEDHYNRIHMR